MDNQFGIPNDLEHKEADLLFLDPVLTPEGKAKKERELWLRVSTASSDLRGDELDQDGADISYFEKFRPIFYNHNYSDPKYLIATATEIKKDGKGWLVKPKFDDDEFAQSIKRKIENGLIKGASIGWKPMDFKWKPDGIGRQVKKWKLFEVSFTPLPMNPETEAIWNSQAKQSKDALPEGTIPFEALGMMPEDTAWDEREISGVDAGTMKKICAIEGRFPHHNSNLKSVWFAVKSAMDSLMTLEDTLNIPEPLRKSAYDHLAGHFREFGKDVPEFKTIETLLAERVIAQEKRIGELESLITEVATQELSARKYASESQEQEEDTFDLTKAKEAFKIAFKDELAKKLGGIK